MIEEHKISLSFTKQELAWSNAILAHLMQTMWLQEDWIEHGGQK